MSCILPELSLAAIIPPFIHERNKTVNAIFIIISLIYLKLSVLSILLYVILDVDITLCWFSFRLQNYKKTIF